MQKLFFKTIEKYGIGKRSQKAAKLGEPFIEIPRKWIVRILYGVNEFARLGSDFEAQFLRILQVFMISVDIPQCFVEFPFA